MGYDELARRLGESGDGARAESDGEWEAASVLAFPDGSVDAYYRVGEAGDESLRSREAFGRAIAGSRSSFPLERERTLPGGQAVNMARQAHALGDAFETVLSVNESELASLADHVGSTAAETGARLDAVRRACDAAAAVVHGSDAATLSTPGGRTRVEMLDVSHVATVTGAGDRFTAGLARARRGVGLGDGPRPRQRVRGLPRRVGANRDETRPARVRGGASVRRVAAESTDPETL